MYPFFDKNIFRRRLYETILWCTNQLNKSQNPDLLRAIVDRPAKLEHLYKSARLMQFANEVFVRRNRIVENYGIVVGDIPQKIDITGGALIIFLVDHAHAWDGIAEIISDRFLDFFEYPPWGSWIYFISSDDMKRAGLEKTSTHIISWVPPQFVEGVKRAIPQNIDGAVLTLEEAKDIFEYLEIIEDVLV